jgi:dihydrofolate reductase
MRKVIVFIATSVDGYIAGPGEDLSFLSSVEEPGQDYGYAAFIETVDTVILGRKTYDKVLSFGIPFPHADKKTFVITRSPRAQQDSVVFYNDDLKNLIDSLKQAPGKNIFVDGGAEVVNALLQQDLIDEFTISLIPCFLGDGVRLFGDGRPPQSLQLAGCRHYPKGLVQLQYTRAGAAPAPLPEQA